MMHEAWHNSSLSKRCINAMVGLWVHEDYCYTLRSSKNENDLKGFFKGELLKIRANYGDCLVHDWVFKTKLENGGRTWRVLHDLTSHTEYCRELILSASGSKHRTWLEL